MSLLDMSIPFTKHIVDGFVCFLSLHLFCWMKTGFHLHLEIRIPPVNRSVRLSAVAWGYHTVFKLLLLFILKAITLLRGSSNAFSICSLHLLLQYFVSRDCDLGSRTQSIVCNGYHLLQLQACLKWIRNKALEVAVYNRHVVYRWGCKMQTEHCALYS